MPEATQPSLPDTYTLRELQSHLSAKLKSTLEQRNLALLGVTAVVRDLQALIHALQRERGSTNLRLSAQHHLYVELMTEFRQESDRARSAVLASLNQLLPQPHVNAMGYGFLNKVALALQALTSTTFASRATRPSCHSRKSSKRSCLSSSSWRSWRTIRIS